MTTPTQHPASTSDARKRAAENAQEGRGATNSAPMDSGATVSLTDRERRALANAAASKAEADLAAAREALARVEALADEWACDDPGCDREGGDFIRAVLAQAAAWSDSFAYQRGVIDDRWQTRAEHCPQHVDGETWRDA